jgi:cytosine/adenosine deaminase-related metal-dependent hydrolase
MKRIFGNAVILAGEELEPMRGYVVVEDGVIAEVGEGNPGKRSYVDLKRGIICPSFTNAHTHIGDAYAKDVAAYKSISERVGKGGVKFELLKDEEKVKQGMKSALREMLASGTLTFADFREGGARGVKLLRSLARASPVEAVVLGRPNGDSPEKLLEHCDGIGISSVADYNMEELAKLRRLAKREGKLFAVHCAEVSDDVAQVLKFNPDFVVHLTNASEASIEEVLRRRVPVVLCPRANGSFAVGLPRIREMLEDTLVALGTDNVMANSLNMLREMEFAFKLARGLSRDYGLDAREILKAATLNSRKLLKLESNAIEEGNPASFVIFRNNNYIYDPVLGIVHRFEVSDIKGIVKGDALLGGNAIV